MDGTSVRMTFSALQKRKGSRFVKKNKMIKLRSAQSQPHRASFTEWFSFLSFVYCVCAPQSTLNYRIGERENKETWKRVFVAQNVRARSHSHLIFIQLTN